MVAWARGQREMQTEKAQEKTLGGQRNVLYIDFVTESTGSCDSQNPTNRTCWRDAVYYV